jgi:NAD(P)-dependent dehydrogenase (short-subunit alcohol dehydrogenase family)
VNNAGIAGPNKPLVEVSEEEWDRVCDINLKAFSCCQAVLPVMLKSWRIVTSFDCWQEATQPDTLFRQGGVICLTRR